jgi:hypothetical protein
MLLVACLVYSLTLKVEIECSLENWRTSTALYDVTSLKTLLFIVTAVRTSQAVHKQFWISLLVTYFTIMYLKWVAFTYM